MQGQEAREKEVIEVSFTEQEINVIKEKLIKRVGLTKYDFFPCVGVCAGKMHGYRARRFLFITLYRFYDLTSGKPVGWYMPLWLLRIKLNHQGKRK